MKVNKYILDKIDQIKGILAENEYRKKRYDNDVKWFEKRKNIIDKNTIRIAIIGITSSGKSTLVNSILGEKILPVAIRPSSSIIITCSKGVKRQAIIYFRDRDPEILNEDNLNCDNIAKYADEIKNPNNKLKVTQIDITTLSFSLGENIEIVDSPGLDACDLEIHEKLTLEILLPTIDICIFLTTVKANSDKVNMEKIKIVNDKNKQIILVQNMIDSVEEKIGKDGIVEEDRNTILMKHKKRAENLINKAINRNDIEIVQISALSALKGIVEKNLDLYNISNFNGFMKSVELCISKVIPSINKERVISICERISTIMLTDKELIESSDAKYINSLMSVTDNDVDQIVNDFKIAKEKIELQVKIMDETISEIITEIETSDSNDAESYSYIVKDINTKNLEIENNILDIVKICEEKKNELYRKLNLDIRFSYSLPSVDLHNVDVKHKYEERTRRIEKNGVFNKGKRVLAEIFNSNWGYEEEGYDEKVVDKDATEEMIRFACNENRKKYTNILWNWTNQYNKSINIFYNEVSKRISEYEEKKEQKIKIDDIEDLNIKLKEVKKNLIKEELNSEDEIALTIQEHKNEINSMNSNNEKNIEYFISPLSYNLYKFINGIIEKNYLLIGDYLSKNINRKFGTINKNIIWTWDIDSCIKFISRLYGFYISEKEINIIRTNGIYVFKNTIVIYEFCENQYNIDNIINNMKDKSLNIYILFNGIQIGSSEKQLKESKYLNSIKEKNKVVLNLVIDSSKEFINAKIVSELLYDINKLKNSIMELYNGQNFGYILINSKNPIYNMALIEGQEKNNFIISDYKEIKERLLENPLSNGDEERDTLEEILNYFLNRREN